MFKRSFTLTILLVAISWLPLKAAEGLLPPTDLRCEYRKNPLGIDAANPRLRWALEATDPSARGQKQAAYQILAASGEERLRNDQGDLWDTGRVESDKSIQVPYEGKPLASGGRVWWKVRVWDNSGKASGWSEPAFWSMGLLEAEGWKGKWIGLEGGEGKPEQFKKAQWIWTQPSGGTRPFRRIIEIPPDNPPSDALLYLVCSGASTLYINGKELTSAKGLNDPISLDVTQALHTGTNVVAVNVNASDNAPSGLIGAVEMELAHGHTVAIYTDDKWQAVPYSVYQQQIDFSDHPGHNSPWVPAKVLGPYGMAPWGEVGWAERSILPARMLRKDFEVEREVKRATLCVSGLGLSEAYLNGAKVGDDVLVPALSDYDKRVFYLTYDVTQRLSPGVNALGVILGNGRYFAPRHMVPTFTRTFGYPSCCCSLKLSMATGECSAW